MSWKDEPIDNDDEGRPMFKGLIGLRNDRNELLATVLWFYDGGPFHSHAVDLNEPDVIRRIGPHFTLEAAKARCLDGIEGRIPDLNKCAGYPR